MKEYIIHAEDRLIFHTDFFKITADSKEDALLKFKKMYPLMLVHDINELKNETENKLNEQY